MQPALNPPGSVAAAHAHMGSGPCHTGRRRWPRPGAPRSGQSRGLHGRDGGHAATLHAAAASRSLLTVVGVHVHRRRHLPRPRPARQDVHTHGSVHASGPIRLCCIVSSICLVSSLCLASGRALLCVCQCLLGVCQYFCSSVYPPVPTARARTLSHARDRAGTREGMCACSKALAIQIK